MTARIVMAALEFAKGVDEGLWVKPDLSDGLEPLVESIASAIREAENAAYDRAYREITLTALMNDDHEPASAEFVNGLVFAADRVRALKSEQGS